jgi:serine/threonine-protein kinase
MVIASVVDLVNAVVGLGLLEPDRQAVLVRELQARFPDPRALGRELIDRGWLTPYQVNQLLQGKIAGLELGPYLLLERLGEGGMGQVFKARHRRLHRVDALKVLRPEYRDTDNADRRFRREAQAVARLDHPHLVRVLDADEADGVLYLAMEYVEGTDLARLVKRDGPLPVGRACDYARQACLGLQHAHEAGLVHRDVKPANLMLTSSGTVKVLDLGLARLLRAPGDDDQSGSLTREGALVGTLDYVAPEQARSSHDVDARTDLYSLGCTLYYLLTGRAPFADSSGIEKLFKHQLDDPPPIEQVRPDVPPALAGVLRTLVAKKPEDRYPTAAAAAAALEPFCGAATAVPLALPVGDPTAAAPTTTALDGETNAEAPAPPAPPILRPRPTGGRGWFGPGVVLVTGGLLLAAAAGVAVLTLGGHRPADTAPQDTAPTSEPKKTLPDKTAPAPTGRDTALPPADDLLDFAPPAETTLLLHVQPKKVLTSGVVRTRFLKEVRDEIARTPELQKHFELLNVNLEADVDRVAVVLVAPDRTLVVARGNFTRVRSRLNAMPLSKVKRLPREGGGIYQVYEISPPAPQPATNWALLGTDTLLGSPDAELLPAALGRVERRAPAAIASVPLRAALRKLDRGAPLAVAGLGDALLSLVAADDDRAQELLPGTVFRGHVYLDEEVRAELVFTAADAGRAALLGDGLDTRRRALATAIGVLPEPARPRDVLLVRQILSDARLTQEGVDVTLRARLTAADFNKLVPKRP